MPVTVILYIMVEMLKMGTESEQEERKERERKYNGGGKISQKGNNGECLSFANRGV